MILLMLGSLLFAGTKEDLVEYVEAIAALPIDSQVDAKDTFRDLKFGQVCSTTPRFVAKGGEDELRGYVRTGEKMSVGKAQLDKVVYICAEDRLRVVLLESPLQESEDVILALVGTYGQPGLQEDKFVYWRGAERTVWAMAEDDKLLVSIGDLPWGDPLGLKVKVKQAEIKAAASDL